jgi:hypothetical protein
VFDLHNVFQERNPSIKQDLPVLTLCRSYLKPYCMGRKTAFFSGHLNLRTTPETILPSRGKKKIIIKLKKTE